MSLEDPGVVLHHAVAYRSTEEVRLCGWSGCRKPHLWFSKFFFISSLHKNLTFKGSGSYDCLSWIKICKFHATDLEIGTY